jgi:hypothetical protein
MGSSEPMIPIEDKLSSVADKRGYTLRRRNAKKLIPVKMFLGNLVELPYHPPLE